MKKLFYVSIFFFLVSNLVLGQQDITCCTLQLQGELTLDALSKEYHRLKRSEVPDEYGCCKYNGSGLMKVMEMLHDSMTIGIPKKKIVEILGHPEKDIESYIRNLSMKPKKKEKILIYPWRGSHDFMYFVVRKGILVRKDWYYAYE